MFLRVIVLVVVFIISTASLGYGFEKQQLPLKVTDIYLRGFDRMTNQTFSLPKLSNPYGLDMDLLVSLELGGKPNKSKPQQKVTLTVSGKAFSTPATGSVGAWNEKLTRTVAVTAEQGGYFIPFVIEYKCYPQVTLTATIGSNSMSKNFALPCAE